MLVIYIGDKLYVIAKYRYKSIVESQNRQQVYYTRII